MSKIPVIYYEKIFNWETIPFELRTLESFENGYGGYYSTTIGSLPQDYLQEGGTIYKIQVIQGVNKKYEQE